MLREALWLAKHREGWTTSPCFPPYRSPRTVSEGGLWKSGKKKHKFREKNKLTQDSQNSELSTSSVTCYVHQMFTPKKCFIFPPVSWAMAVSPLRPGAMEPRSLRFSAKGCEGGNTPKRCGNIMIDLGENTFKKKTNVYK